MLKRKSMKKKIVVRGDRELPLAIIDFEFFFPLDLDTSKHSKPHLDGMVLLISVLRLGTLNSLILLTEAFHYQEHME